MDIRQTSIVSVADARGRPRPASGKASLTGLDRGTAVGGVWPSLPGPSLIMRWAGNQRRLQVAADWLPPGPLRAPLGASSMLRVGIEKRCSR